MLLPAEAITVPVDEGGTPPESETSTQTSKKQKTTKDMKKDKTGPGSEGTEAYVRGKAALKVYWDELANAFPSGPDAATLKQAVLSFCVVSDSVDLLCLSFLLII